VGSAQQAQNRILEPVDYVEMPRLTFGAEFTMSLCWFGRGPAIPPEVYDSGPVRATENAAIDFCTLFNDGFSAQKESSSVGADGIDNMVWTGKVPASGTPGLPVDVTNTGSSLLMDVASGSTAPGAKVIQWHSNGGDYQKWTLNRVADNVYTLNSVKSSRAWTSRASRSPRTSSHSSGPATAPPTSSSPPTSSAVSPGPSPCSSTSTAG